MERNGAILGCAEESKTSSSMLNNKVTIILLFITDVLHTCYWDETAHEICNSDSLMQR